MKVLTYIFPFLLAISFSEFNLSRNAVNITGHVKIDSTKISLSKNNLLIIVRNNHKILTKAHTDKNGDFQLTLTSTNEKIFKFYCSSPSIGTILIGSTKRFESDAPEMTFLIPPKSNSEQ